MTKKMRCPLCDKRVDELIPLCTVFGCRYLCSGCLDEFESILEGSVKFERNKPVDAND